MSQEIFASLVQPRLWDNDREHGPPFSNSWSLCTKHHPPFSTPCSHAVFFAWNTEVQGYHGTHK